MTNDLLPDEIDDALAWWRNCPSEKWDSKYARQIDKLVLAGLESTPNKPAEVDWDEMQRFLEEGADEPDWNASWVIDRVRTCLQGQLATGKGGGDKASSGFKLTGEHVRQIMRSPAYWREKDPAVMKMVQECFEYLTEKDRAEIESLEQTEQQKTAEPCGDVQAALDWLYEKATAGCAEFTDQLPDNYNTVFMALKQPAAPTQIDAGELERAIEKFDNFIFQYEHDREWTKVLADFARAHFEKSKGGV